MKSELLITLLRLFAIIVKDDGLTAQNESLVSNFLSQQFDEKTVKRYLENFSKYVESSISDSNEIESIITFCNEVNNELNYEQKIFILIRVIELAYANQQMSREEERKILIAARNLNIDHKEYSNIYTFITTNHPLALEGAPYLIHISLEETKAGEVIKDPNYKGEYISALHGQTGNMLIMRYIGTSEVSLSAQPIKSNIVYILKPGAVIRAPKVEPIYFSDILEKFLYPIRDTKIIFEARNISYRFKEGKMGLNDVQLVEESGRMVAIMGGSGAGKSTLLNVLNGNFRPTLGTVTINGESVHDKPEAIQGILGYVAQEDVLIEELSVYQNLFFNAQLCFDHKKLIELDLMVNNTLSELGLEEIKDLKVGSPSNDKLISGGQRKRLNIAMELIREPHVLFVDEPTSGLSSRDSQNVMDLLKELAHKGKLIIVVIHQPSSDIFKLFDRLLLLDLGGYPVFYGKPSEALRNFRKHLDYVNSEQIECPECGNINPEQIFSILETKVVDEFGKPTNTRKMTPKQWNALYRNSLDTMERQRDALRREALEEVIHEDGVNVDKIAGKLGSRKAERIKYDSLSPSSGIPSKIKQIKVFIRRDVLAKRSNPSYLALSSLIAPLLGFGISFLLRSYPLEQINQEYALFFNDDLPVYLFISILIALFIGLTISSQEILKDRKIRKREQFLHLSKASYLVAKITTLFSLVAIQMLIYTLVGSWVLGIKELIIDQWILLFSTACFAVMLGLNLSATFTNAVTIYIAIPILLIPQIVLSGTMVSFNKLNPLISNQEVVPFISDLAASRWAYEAIAVHQFKENKYQKLFYTYDKDIANSQYKLNSYFTTLETKLGYCNEHYKKPLDKPLVKKELLLIKNELNNELSTYNTVPSNFNNVLNRLYLPRFNSIVGRDVQHIIDILRNKHQKREQEARRKFEKKVKLLEAQHVNLEVLQHTYDNKALAQVVQNPDKTVNIIEFGGKLIRIGAPVYQNPKFNKWFFDYREHFYAPAKAFAGHVIDTFWFNILVIWFMTGILYITLYFETFASLILNTQTLIVRIRNWWDK